MPNYCLPRAQLRQLFAELGDRGYRIIGPTRRDDAIVYAELDRPEELPIGLSDEQSPGRYRLRKRQDAAVFGFVVGPESPRRWLQVPQECLVQLRRKDRGFTATAQQTADPRPRAFFGMRACEIAALAVQDKIFTQGAYPDPAYAGRRDGALIISVSCNEPAATCFCASLNTGPRPQRGFDLSLTELGVDSTEQHRFLVEVGSARGEELVQALDLAQADDADSRRADDLASNAAQSMQRSMDASSVRELLLRNPEHRHWEDVAQRCLACTNCTMVCPTCFCSRIDDETTLDGQQTQRIRRWDSCFSEEYSYIHGGAVRTSVKARYRHWLTHKLATWVDQFGELGCVGCGRCITWCPAGIDLTQEIRALQRGAVA